MALINAIAFRLPTNRVWQYQNTLLFRSSLYGESIRSEFFTCYFMKRYFERSHFRKYLFIFSHVTVHCLNDNSLNFTIFFYSKFYRGLIRFLYRHMYRVYRKRYRKRVRLMSLFYTFHKRFGRLNGELNKLLTLYRLTLVRTLSAYHKSSKVILNFRLINRLAFSASYAVNFFAYGLNSGVDLNRTLKSTFTMFEKGFLTGLRGIKVVCAGRFTRKQRAHVSVRQAGFVHTSSLKAKVDYALMTTRLKYGASSIRIWLNYK